MNKEIKTCKYYNDRGLCLLSVENSSAMKCWTISKCPHKNEKISHELIEELE